MEISIIIPVYNSARYLDRCLGSVLVALSRVKGEILVIDNGSSDDSLAILKNYAKKYHQIVVLRCDTPGAAAVRNFGVQKARGEYIWFVDADDEIDKTAVRKLLAKANNTGADMVMMGMKRVYGDGTTNYLSAVNASDREYKSRFIRYGMGPVQVVVRRKWWLRCGLRFCEGIIHEDMELMSSLILYTDKFADVDEPLYVYYQNPGSVLHKEKFDKHIFDIFPALEGLYKKFQEAGAEKKYAPELEWFFIWNLLIDSAKDFAKFPEGKVGFQRSRKMLLKYFPGWRKNKFLRQKPVKLQIRVRLNYRKK